MNIYKLGFSKWNLFLKKNKSFHSYSPLLSSNPFKNNFILELKQRREIFYDVLPEVVDSFTNSFGFKDMADVNCWMRKILDYNLSGGKLIRGTSTVLAYETFEKPDNLTDKTIRLSYIMGWCVEMAYGLLVDDIMDSSEIRRGVPCWYTLPNVGLRAINDSMIIFMTFFHTLKSHFGHLPQYPELMDLIHKVLVFTCVGQHLDYTAANRDKDDYSKFTLEHYNTLANYKTAHTFKLAVGLGMLLAKNTNKESHRKAEEICLKIGGLFQMQDDFIDVFELESKSGKKGSDVQEGKCTWLAVTALQRCNDAQRKEFVSCYGRPDPALTDRIKRLYVELNVPELYKQEERRRYDELVDLVNAFKEPLGASELFFNLLDVIYNRNI